MKIFYRVLIVNIFLLVFYAILFLNDLRVFNVVSVAMIMGLMILTNVMIALIRGAMNKPDAKFFLLAALLVLVIGFSVCSIAGNI